MFIRTDTHTDEYTDWRKAEYPEKATDGQPTTSVISQEKNFGAKIQTPDTLVLLSWWHVVNRCVLNVGSTVDYPFGSNTIESNLNDNDEK